MDFNERVQPMFLRKMVGDFQPGNVQQEKQAVIRERKNTDTQRRD